MDLTILFVLLSILGVATVACLKVEKGNSLGKLTALLLGIILLGYSNSAVALTSTDVTFGALAAKDSAISADNKQFEEELKSTPSGNHYTGLEYPEEMGSGSVQMVDDDSLTESIQSYSGDDVVVGVASGSVRLSGKVSNKKAAKDLIEKIKGVPGVREITFDLGYDS